MKTIAVLIPYFGKLPYNFELFLNCCRYNKTLDFMIFTDDTRKWDLPPNVRMYTMAFEEMQDKIKAMYDFEICISRPVSASKEGVVHNRSFFVILTTDSFEALTRDLTNCVIIGRHMVNYLEII